jgi:hypothetical protein
MCLCFLVHQVCMPFAFKLCWWSASFLLKMPRAWFVLQVSKNTQSAILSAAFVCFLPFPACCLFACRNGEPVGTAFYGVQVSRHVAVVDNSTRHAAISDAASHPAAHLSCISSPLLRMLESYLALASDRGADALSVGCNTFVTLYKLVLLQEPQLYPCVGMRTANEEIRANFGATPFAVDFAALQQQFRQRILDSISAVKLPAAVDLAASPAAAVAAAGGGSGGGAAAAANTPSTSSRRSAAAAAEGGSGGGGEAAATAAGALQPAAHVLLAAMGQAAAAAAQEGETADGAAAAADADAGSSKPSGSSKASSYSQPLLPYLIFDYLLHQRCWRTAAVVARDMLEGPVKASTAAAAAAARPIGDAAAPMECSSGEDTGMPDAAAAAAAAAAATSGTPADAAAAAGTGAAGGLSEAAIQDALTRQQIFDAVAAGQLSDALQQVEQHFGPAVLQGNPKLAFKLKVQQFVELVRQATSGSSAAAAAAAANGSKTVAAAAGVGGFEAALAYGRAELGPGSKSPDEEELLSDALSLLAYADPAASPCGHLLRVGQRLQLAEELNGALLQVS